MARVRRARLNALLADPRVHMFALTSGTTATRKYIPVTRSVPRRLPRGWNIWGLKVFRDHPEVTLRPIVQMSGDWDEFRTEAGIPCGAVTGLTATMQKRIIRWLYCVPAVRRPDQGRRGQVLRRPAAEPAAPGRHDHRRQPQHAHQPGPRRRPGKGIAASATSPTARSTRASTCPPTCAAAAAAGCDATRARAANWKRSSTAPARSIRSDYWPRELPAGQLDRRQRRRLPAALSALLRRPCRCATSA